MDLAPLPAAAALTVSPSITPAVRLRDVTIAYDRHPVVHHLNGVFAAGSLTAIVGPNGAGKSSLIKAIAGLISLSSGRIEREGRGGFAYLPQAIEVDRSFPVLVREVVDLGHWHRSGAWRRLDAAALEASRRALAEVGLSAYADHPIAALSAGQFQRVLFARLIVENQALILLDEPFNAVDEATATDLLAIVARWHAQGRTVIAVLHDLASVQQSFPETLLLAREAIAWGPTQEALHETNLAAARRRARGWGDLLGRQAEVCGF